MLHSQKHRAPELLKREHASQLATLHATSFHKGWSEDFFAKILESSTGLAFGVFDSKSELIGFCLCRWVIDEAEILTIAVNSAMRQQGLGSSLLSSTCDSLRSKGVLKVFLEVSEHNEAALSLYRKQGFLPVGARRHYYLDTDDTPDNAIVLELFQNN